MHYQLSSLSVCSLHMRRSLSADVIGIAEHYAGIFSGCACVCVCVRVCAGIIVCVGVFCVGAITSASFAWVILCWCIYVGVLAWVWLYGCERFHRCGSTRVENGGVVEPPQAPKQVIGHLTRTSNASTTSNRVQLQPACVVSDSFVCHY